LKTKTKVKADPPLELLMASQNLFPIYPNDSHP